MGVMPRKIALSRSGRYLAVRHPDRIELVDALGTAPRRNLPITGEVIDFCCVGSMAWVVSRAGTIERYTLQGLRAVAPPIVIGDGAQRITPAAGDHTEAALIEGRRSLLVHAPSEHVTIDTLALDATVFPLVGRRLLAISTSDVRVFEPGRDDVMRMPRFTAAPAIAAFSLFDGRALAVLTVSATESQIVVLRAQGGIVHKIAVPPPRRWAVAERRGVAVLAVDGPQLVAIDLRYGRVQEAYDTALAIEDLAIDADAQFIAFAGAPDAGEPSGAVHHMPYTDFVAAVRRGGSRSAPVDDPPASREVFGGAVVAEASDAVVPDAADADAELAPPTVPSPPPIALPDRPPLALGVPPTPMTAEHPAPPPIAGYESPREHIDELVDLMAARAGRAIAAGWDSGRLSGSAGDLRPFEREVLALLGANGNFASELLADAERRLAELSRRVEARAAATIAAGRPLPLFELVRELQLSATAVQVLVAIAAPYVRGEVARLYGVLANDEHRPVVDRYLAQNLIAGDDLRARAEVAAELAADAPLVRYGIVRQDDEAPLFAALSVDPMLIDRLYGRDTGAEGSGATTLRTARRSLEELHVPAELKREIVLALAEPRSRDAPIRIVLRGRRGAGRHSLVAALAARIAHRVAEIDVNRLPRAPKLLAEGLRLELTRALLRRAVPVVSGLETVDAADAEGQDIIKHTVRAHPGPIAIRAPIEGALPIATGYVSFTLPTLTETERVEFWEAALARARLPIASVEVLAQRFRIGPGTIERVIGEVVVRRRHLGIAADDDAGAMIIEAARQHIAIRLGNVASQVTRLARWEQVSLADDVLDSLKEFIARTRHRRTVYDRWGFDAKMTTSRGLSALFYGPPGTGKSMVAGLIARELGLDLYRVDLARVVSKWIGETEKNLAEIFDAAEDGQVVILFDEADSLFTKRTEVKSSVDRYANLEVNYLLQRLDSFEGICILTTNLEGSVDPAFKRRMSLRLQFPFPDEEMRARLWAAHIPSDTPTLRDFDYADLAHRFPLSGGYIRNSVLRAAFLAVQEARPLSQSHLLRAIQLEYRELGKLSTTGRME